MPKRQGYVYDKMWQWETLKEADIVSCRKKKNYGVKKHSRRWLQDLIEVQQMILNHEMRTDEYQYMRRKSGQDKWRDIAKLKFMPNRIEHQCLVIAGDERLEKALIPTTFASRKGKGQIRAALQIQKWLRKDPDGCLWYGQCDIVKYYENAPHNIYEQEIRRLYKDEDYIQAMMEPFERFSDTGVGFPLGARPSQEGGNVVLMSLDRYAKQERRIKYYIRYLDDFTIFGRTKGEVKKNIRLMREYVENVLGLKLHEPKIRPITEGLDMLGFVFYKGGDMFWRKKNKRRWLRHRAKLTNKKRIRELDDAAWAMLKWGNKHCKRLFKMVTGISMADLGIKMPEKRDKEGRKIIDATNITAKAVMNRSLIISDWVRGVTTRHGDGRYALLVEFFDEKYKLIINAPDLKCVVDAMDESHVSKFKATLKDKGGNHFYFDDIEVLAINGRDIGRDKDGVLRYLGNGEKIDINSINK